MYTCFVACCLQLTGLGVSVRTRFGLGCSDFLDEDSVLFKVSVQLTELGYTVIAVANLETVSVTASG